MRRVNAAFSRARSAMQKKVARAPCAASMPSTAGVIRGSGPSSIVIATSLRARAASGKRSRFGPSRVLRGHKPVAVSAT